MVNTNLDNQCEDMRPDFNPDGVDEDIITKIEKEEDSAGNSGKRSMRGENLSLDHYSNENPDWIQHKKLTKYLDGLRGFLPETEDSSKEMAKSILPYLVRKNKKGPRLYRKDTINLIAIRLYRQRQTEN